MDKDLQTTIKELCEILEPMNIKLKKWLLKQKSIFSCLTENLLI